MKTLMKYDFMYLKRTSKFIVFGVIVVLFAILSPLTAKYMNDILEALLGSEGIGIVLPPATVYESYVQYIGNLYEIVLFVTVFVGVSIFMREKNKGELPLILSKPVDRTQYLLSKFTSFTLLILGSLIIGGFVFAYYTYYLFATVDLLVVLNISLLFLLYTTFILSIAMFMSMYMSSYAGASILTFVGYIVFSILGGFDKGFLDYLPGRITNRIAEVIMDTTDNLTLWLNILVIVVFEALLIYFSITKFKKYDI